jgi:hypothetical protein
MPFARKSGYGNSDQRLHIYKINKNSSNFGELIATETVDVSGGKIRISHCKDVFHNHSDNDAFFKNIYRNSQYHNLKGTNHAKEI